MTFARDPAVLRVEAQLGDRKAARAAVRALVTVAPRAQPWIDAEDIRVTTGARFEAGALYEALVRARLVEVSEAAGGIVLTHEGEVLRVILEAERQADAEKKFQQRARRTSGGHLGDIEGTSEGHTGDTDGTLAGHCGGHFGTPPAASCASPITRAPGARGNSSPSSSPPSTPSSPAASPADLPITDPAEAHRVATSLRRVLLRYITAPPALADDIAEDLLAGRVTPDELMAAAKQSPRHGGKSYAYLLALVESARESEAASRAPPPVGQRGANDPVPIEELRMLREWDQRNGGEEW